MRDPEFHPIILGEVLMKLRAARRRVVDPPDLGAGGFHRLQPPAADLLAVLQPAQALGGQFGEQDECGHRGPPHWTMDDPVR